MQDTQALIEVTSGARAQKVDEHEDGTRVVARVLNNREKAAVVVRLLLNEGADIPLEELPDALQEKLTHQLGRVGLGTSEGS